MALKLALTDRATEGRILVIENLNYDKPSTKSAKALIDNLVKEKGRILIVTKGNDKAVVRSFSNLEFVETGRANGLHAYGILKNSFIVMTEEALQQVEEVFGK